MKSRKQQQAIPQSSHDTLSLSLEWWTYFVGARLKFPLSTPATKSEVHFGVILYHAVTGSVLALSPYDFIFRKITSSWGWQESSPTLFQAELHLNNSSLLARWASFSIANPPPRALSPLACHYANDSRCSVGCCYNGVLYYHYYYYSIWLLFLLFLLWFG